MNLSDAISYIPEQVNTSHTFTKEIQVICIFFIYLSRVCVISDCDKSLKLVCTCNALVLLITNTLIGLVG